MENIKFVAATLLLVLSLDRYCLRTLTNNVAAMIDTLIIWLEFEYCWLNWWD